MARIMGVKHLSPAGVASGLYAALMNVIFLAQRIGMPLALLKSYGVPSEIAFEHDGGGRLALQQKSAVC
jgi:hypothetical protein